MVKVHVKWQKETFKDVEVDESQPPLVFKTQLFTLSGVPPERQKIMVKGGLLKDDGDWAKLGLKEGQKLMMMGTADAVPEAPKEATVFLEDLPEEEQYNQETKAYGAGLQNLGNTCYMNATVQCLFSVPPLKSALQQYAATPVASSALHTDPAHRLVMAANDLWRDLDASASSVPPMRFLMALREKFPQFSQQGDGGMFMQQDAEECWTQFLYVLRERLRENGASAADSAIQKMFGLGLHTSLKCEEGDETIEEDSTALTLKCNISIDINHLEQGIDLALVDDREKYSAALGRTALFKGKSSLTSLPPFLTVQMVRFYYKVDVQQKAKILRKVTFPPTLDLFDRCTEELKKELEEPREAYKRAEDNKVGIKKAEAEAGASGDVEMIEAAPSNQGRPTGKYSLQAVLTHKGRSADSGHYVSWVKQDDGKWVEFDDDNLILREADDILKLCGGGDWHMAYMLLYKAETI